MSKLNEIAISTHELACFLDSRGALGNYEHVSNVTLYRDADEKVVAMLVFGPADLRKAFIDQDPLDRSRYMCSERHWPKNQNGATP